MSFAVASVSGFTPKNLGLSELNQRPPRVTSMVFLTLRAQFLNGVGRT